MKKSLFIFSILSVVLLADTNLGTPIGNSATKLQTKNQQKKSALETTTLSNSKVQPNYNHLTTRITPKKVKSTFKQDNHRYDKRYSNFDYESNGYYNDDNYYYGYYDNLGYFYDNIYYTYDDQYTYYDRQHRLGYFGYAHHHHRPYLYHSFNRWNRIHCYREPNVVVYGHYYEHSYHPQPETNYYPSYDNRYGNHYSQPARMTTRHNEYHAPRSHTNSFHSSHNYNDSRMSTSHSHRDNSHTYHRSVSRMQVAH